MGKKAVMKRVMIGLMLAFLPTATWAKKNETEKLLSRDCAAVEDYYARALPTHSIAVVTAQEYEVHKANATATFDAGYQIGDGDEWYSKDTDEAGNVVYHHFRWNLPELRDFEDWFARHSDDVIKAGLKCQETIGRNEQVDSRFSELSRTMRGMLEMIIQAATMGRAFDELRVLHRYNKLVDRYNGLLAVTRSAPIVIPQPLQAPPQHCDIGIIGNLGSVDCY